MGRRIRSEGESTPLSALDDEMVGPGRMMERLTDPDAADPDAADAADDEGPATPLTLPPSANALLKSATLFEDTEERPSKKLLGV